MGLVASIYSIDVQQGYCLTKELARFHRDWFIHEYLKEHYHDIKDGFDNDVKLTLELVNKLHRTLCDELYREALDINLTQEDETIFKDSINQIKHTIQYMNNNPNKPVYYGSAY